MTPFGGNMELFVYYIIRMKINYRSYEVDIQEGDVVLFRTKLEPLVYPESLLSAGIRLFTQCDYNHCAVVANKDGKLYLIEAKAEGVVSHPVEDVLKRDNDKIIILRMKNPPKDVSERAISKIGTPYDYDMLFIYQVIYRTPKLLFGRYGKWVGPTGDKAAGEEVCSELVAYSYSFPEFWKYSAAELLANQDFGIIFKEAF